MMRYDRGGVQKRPKKYDIINEQPLTTHSAYAAFFFSMSLSKKNHTRDFFFLAQMWLNLDLHLRNILFISYMRRKKISRLRIIISFSPMISNFLKYLGKREKNYLVCKFFKYGSRVSMVE